ncbi:SWIM zinc finger family protein [Brachybacterium tyrofermentans]|uniref:SWIM zinc finger family protein n=1 Tax=Brachybacterium tyrofermentans TaxID=47848 RepID=UPI003FCF3F91
MRKSEISVDVLSDRVGDVLFERGRRYAADGRVRLLGHTTRHVAAVVTGSEDYEVEIELAERGFLGSCTCPFAEDWDVCKHMVAVLLRWLEVDSEDTPDVSGSSSPEPEVTVVGSASGEGTRDVEPRAGDEEDELLRAHLAQLPVGRLVGELLAATRVDAMLRARLLVEAGAPAATAFDEAPLRSALVEAFSVEGFVHYRDAGDYFWGIGEVLDEVGELIEEGFAASAARLTLFALDLVGEFGQCADDSDGGLVMVLQQIEEIHLRASKSVAPDPDALAATLVEQAVDSWTEVFFDAASEYAEILGEGGLHTYRDLLAERWRGLPARGEQEDGGRFAVRYLREQVAEVLGGTDQLIEVLTEHAEVSHDYLRIAGLLHREGRADEALEWIDRGLGTCGSDASLLELAASIHREAGRVDLAGELLWKNFTDAPGTFTYRSLKSGTGADFTRWRDRALSVLKELGTCSRGGDCTALVSSLLWEGDIDGAWVAAQEGGCRSSLWLELARARARTNPSDALPLLMREAERAVDGAQRSAYRCAAELLHEARDVARRASGLEHFDRHVREMRERNRRRPALQDEFTRAGLP